MNPDAARRLAAEDHLYPSVILYGASAPERQALAVELARTLLCESADRPCGHCRPCTRLDWPGDDGEGFHPDFHVLQRDLKSSTSVDATKKFLTATASTPFEARGQVFVVAEADTLNAGAADALLKTLEEPPGKTPRHFFLLAGSRLDLQVTLRSRSMAIFLGAVESLDEGEVAELTAALNPILDLFERTSSAACLLAMADVFTRSIDGWEDARARRPWAIAAAAVVACAESRERERRALLALAADLMDAWQLRMRAIAAPRVLEGLLARHLGVL